MDHQLYSILWGKPAPLPWTRVVPDHYDLVFKPPSPPTDVRKRPLPFMFLPLEIRLQVYRIYLVDRYTLSPTEIHEMVLDSRHRTKSSAEILRVSKTVNGEVRDLLQQEKTIKLRICWQDATLDGFAISCLQSRGVHQDYDTTLVYDHIAHLRVEIYPEHEDRPTDMVCVWKYVQSLCLNLQKAPRVPKMSIHFMENEYAEWSIGDQPWETFEASYDTDGRPCNILHILSLFRLLKNVEKAQIHLPVSVAEDLSLHEAAKMTEAAMMRTISLDDRHQQSVIETIEKAIKDEDKSLKYYSGSCAQERLDKLCPSGTFMLEHHFEIFERVWPHRDCELKELYGPSSLYIGDEYTETDPSERLDPYERVL